MKQFRVSIIIPNWNGQRILAKNLPQVIEAKRFKGNNVSEIIIVDDKSEDDSVKFLENKFGQEIKLIRHTKNRGFSAAVNTGVRASESSLVCLLNTDVIPERDFLVKALHHYRDRNVFAVSLHEKGYSHTKGKFENGFIVYEQVPESNIAQRSFWASGGSAIFRRKIWMELRGFDEELFSPFYWEDIDISYRAQKRGYKVFWEPNARVIHKHESVINPKSFDRKWLDLIKERNQLLLIWKNLTSPILFKRHLSGLLARVVSHPGYLRVILSALKKIKVVIKLRAREKRESSVSDEAVLAVFD